MATLPGLQCSVHGEFRFEFGQFPPAGRPQAARACKAKGLTSAATLCSCRKRSTATRGPLDTDPDAGTATSDAGRAAHPVGRTDARRHVWREREVKNTRVTSRRRAAGGPPRAHRYARRGQYGTEVSSEWID